MALAAGVDRRELEARLFPTPLPSQVPRPLPDWAEVHREMRTRKKTKWTCPGITDGYGVGFQAAIRPALSNSTGVMYPRAECLRRVLYQPSMYSKVASLASS